jgi:hypothetical protein
MKTAPFLIHCLMMVVLVSGCNRSSLTPPQPDAGAADPKQQSTLALPSPAPSEDVLSPSITPVVSATKIPTASVVDGGKQCMENLIEPPISLPGFEGKIVLLSKSFSSHDSYLLDVATGQRTQLAVQDKPYLLSAAVSPNGHWLAYVVSSKIYEDDLLLISTIDGKVEKQYNMGATLKKADD